MNMWKYYLPTDEISDKHLEYVNRNLFNRGYVLWAWTCDPTIKTEFEKYRDMNKFRRVKSKIKSSDELVFYLDAGRDDAKIIINDFEDRYDMIDLATTRLELDIIYDEQATKFSDLYEYLLHPKYVNILKKKYKQTLDFLIYYSYSAEYYSEEIEDDNAELIIDNLEWGYTILGNYIGNHRMSSYVLFVEEFYYLLEVKMKG